MVDKITNCERLQSKLEKNTDYNNPSLKTPIIIRENEIKLFF